MNDLPRGYDAWRTSGPPDPLPVGYCEYCGDKLYAGEGIIETIDGEWVHSEDVSDCWRHFVEDAYVSQRFVVHG